MWCNFKISTLYKTQLQVILCQTQKLDAREWRVFTEPVTYYEINTVSDIQDWTDEIATEFLPMCVHFPKIIVCMKYSVYERSYKDFITIYQLLKGKMGLGFTDPSYKISRFVCSSTY